MNKTSQRIFTTTSLVLSLLSLTLTAQAAINRPPTAIAQNVITNEDAAVVITLAGTDPEGASLQYRVARNPSKGALSCTGAICTYTPVANINGTDFFTFTVNDGSVNSRAATVSLTIQPINDVPTIELGDTRLAEDATVNIRPTRKDVDGDVTTLQIINPPIYGSATVSGDLIVYTPNPNYNGNDQIGIAAYDGTVLSNTATANLTIDSTNDAPTATGQAVVTNEDSSVVIPLMVNDIDHDPLTVSFAYQSHDGQVSADGSTVTYIPNPDFFGTDHFTYRVTDGVAWSETVQVDLTINSVNDVPVALSVADQVIAGQTTVLDLSATDSDGHVVSYQLNAPAQYGQATVMGNHILYQADDADGIDTFSYSAIDNDGSQSAPTAITIEVLPTGTVVPISITDLELVTDFTVELTSGQRTTTFEQHECFDTIATPLVVPVQLEDGTVVEAIAFMFHSKCPNTTILPNQGVLVLTTDGTAWRFTSEGDLNLHPDAQATGHFDPRGILSYPLYFTTNDTDDADYQTGGFVQYSHGETIFTNIQAGRPYDTATLSLDGIVPLLTINPYIPTCQTNHKIDAENCGVLSFMNLITQSVLDQAYQVDNAFEAWGTAAGTRAIQKDAVGRVIADQWFFGTGPAANADEPTTIDGGCAGYFVDVAALRTAVLLDSFETFNLFSNTYDPGEVGCTGLSTAHNSLLKGSAMQGEAVIGQNPTTNAVQVWWKGFEPDVTGSSQTRIASTDTSGNLVCETLVDGGVNKTPFNRASTGMVIDHLGNAYTNVDYYNTNGILMTGMMQINPTDCTTHMLVDLTASRVGGSMSGLTLAQNAAGNHLVLGAVGTSLYLHDLEDDTTTTVTLSDAVKEYVAAPVITSTGEVDLVAIDNTVYGLPLDLSYGDHFWPRFRKDNFGSATVEVAQ